MITSCFILFTSCICLDFINALQSLNIEAKTSERSTDSHKCLLEISMCETIRISLIKLSNDRRISAERVRYLSLFLYTPISAFIPSNCPITMAMGVLSSWETPEKNKSLRRSRSFSIVISSCNEEFFCCKSDIASLSLSESSLRLFARTPISSSRRSGQYQLKSNSAIFAAVLLIRIIGRVVYLEKIRALKKERSIMSTPIHGKLCHRAFEISSEREVLNFTVRIYSFFESANRKGYS